MSGPIPCLSIRGFARLINLESPNSIIEVGLANSTEMVLGSHKPPPLFRKRRTQR